MGVVISLNQRGRVSRSEVGGKAAHLCEMIQLGLPVPPTWVLPVSAFRRVASKNKDQPDPLMWSLPEDWLSDWSHIAKVIDGPMAVRSSSPVEDGALKSFAGQFETRLNVTADGLENAIRQCWASANSAMAAAYTDDNAEPVEMAVVIQPMVEPLVSGVLFTINPMNGSWREISVEAVWGQGEGLVSGHLSPHWYLVRRPRGRLARIRLSVLSTQVHPLTQQFASASAGGLERVEVPKRRQSRPTLDSSELIKLCRMGLKLERHFGCPQDVEWCKTANGTFVFLQSRPITTRSGPRERNDVVWTRRFLGERWPERASVLGWSLMAPLLDHFIAYPETQRELLGGGEAVQLMRGRPYLNASVFPHLAFKLPGVPAPHFLLEMMAPDEVAVWRRKFAVMPDVAVYRSLLEATLKERRWRRFRWNPFTNPTSWAQFEQEASTERATLAECPKDREEAITRVEQHMDWLRRYVGIHVCSLLYANIWDQLLEGVLASVLPTRARALHRGLATCPEGNKTLACNEAVFELAHSLGEDGIEALSVGEPLSPLHQQELAVFLSVYGDRSDAGWEVFSTRWREAPERLAPTLRSALSSPSPKGLAGAQQARFRAAEAELKSRLSGPQLWMVLRGVSLLREYLLLRENQRFVFEGFMGSLKQTLLWLGERGVEDGWLSHADAVRFVEFETLCAATRKQIEPEVMLQRVQRARMAWDKAGPQEAPDFLRGEEALMLPVGGHRLQGLGVSAGRVTATVRVLGSPADAKRLQPGDILVARSVDPGWTPLFATAGGLILELGGRLSHGAVVAREYQLPAVFQVGNATAALHDGQVVTLDGEQGLIWVSS